MAPDRSASTTGAPEIPRKSAMPRWPDRRARSESMQLKRGEDEGPILSDVYRPYDRTLYARVAAGGRPEATIAVDAAAKAFPAWSQTSPAERARLFFKAAEIAKRRRDEVAEILAVETGSTISFAKFQQDLVAATLEQAA